MNSLVDSYILHIVPRHCFHNHSATDRLDNPDDMQRSCMRPQDDHSRSSMNSLVDSYILHIHLRMYV